MIIENTWHQKTKESAFGVFLFSLIETDKFSWVFTNFRIFDCNRIANEILDNEQFTLLID